jgi:hypothetical protein
MTAMNPRSGFVLCAALLLLIQIARAADSDLNITCEKKRLELQSAKAQKPDANGVGESKSAEQWGYNVTVENQSFQPLANLQVKYIIFFKREQLGVKGPPKKETQTGTYSITSIDSNGKTSFDTDSVKLSKASLVGVMGGSAYFANGAKSSAEDTLSGIWVRVYKDGNLFAEYAYPAGLTSSEQWQE